MFTLVLNVGSSSLRFALFDEKLQEFYKAHVDGIKKADSKNIQKAVESVLKTLIQQGLIKDLKEIAWVGHRVVHGGEKFTAATPLTAKTIREIKKLSTLAPLHNPVNLKGVEAAQNALPHAKHFAIFDTAFHTTLPESAALYALPYKMAQKHQWHRYGFHGTSHRYVTTEAAKILGKKNAKLISCHMGNGVSLCAVKNGKSVDTTMGYTPLEGPCMGTRSGSIDPGLVLEMVKTLGLKKTEETLLHESGLKGLSGVSSDVRVLREKPKSPETLRSLEVMAYQMSKALAALFASLEGLPDAIIFTAGIGEHAHYLRSAILKPFASLGLKLNATANRKNALTINDPKSTIKVLVIPTREEWQMAKEIHEHKYKNS